MIVNKEKYKWEVGGKQDSASLEAGCGWPPEVLTGRREGPEQQSGGVKPAHVWGKAWLEGGQNHSLYW